MNAVTNPFDSPTVAARQSEALVAIEAQRAIAEVQAMAIMAKKFPRDQRAAMDRILNACTRPQLAEQALYTYARGGTEITGPSIRLAEALAQQWGNFLFGIKELDQRPGESTMQAYAIDLETITRQEKVFQVKHIRDTKKGGYALTDQRDIYELTANQGARRLRACILGVIPGDVIEAAVKQCETTLKTKAEVTPERIASLLEKFGEYGVTKEMIEKRIQRHIETMTPAQMVDLGKKYNSMKDGMSSAADWFEVAPPADGEAQAKTSGVSTIREAAKKASGKAGAEPKPAPGVADEKQRTLDAIARTDDEEIAALALDGARGQPWYGEVEEAYREKFAKKEA